MSLQSKRFPRDATILAAVKAMSGKRIEERRRQVRLSQERLAANVGIGVRWLREIEAGNPQSRLDDHLKCAHGVGLSTGYLFLPLIVMENQTRMPRESVLEEMTAIVEQFIRFMTNCTQDLLPDPDEPAPPEAA